MAALAIMNGVSSWQRDGSLGFQIDDVSGVRGFRVLLGDSGGGGRFSGVDVQAIATGYTAWSVETFSLSFT